MTREQKLALILGFAIVLVVGVLVSDHLSGARTARSDPPDAFAGKIEPSVDPGLGRPERDVLVWVDPEPLDREPPRPLDERYFDIEGEPARSRSLVDSLADGARGLGTEALDVIRSGELPRPVVQPDTIVMGDPVEPADNRPTRAGTSRTSDRDAGYVVHRVVQGDSLWSIAERYYGDGSMHTMLRERNADRLGADGTIFIGASLIIPDREGMRRGREVGASGGAGASGGVRGTSVYEVRAGDTLSEIAQRELGTSKRWREILSANEGVLDGPRDLRVGMRLRIPAR